MAGDEVQPMVGATKPRIASTAQSLLRLVRLNNAEIRDIGLFLAPGRCEVAQQMLMACVFGPPNLPAPKVCNDN